MNLEVEVLVVGAGPAGIHAASIAAAHGCDVLLLDDNPSPGGQIWRESTAGLPQDADEARRKSLLVLRASGARVFAGWTVFDAPADRTLSAIQQDGAETSTIDIRYQKLVLATGARERFLPFPGWTLPGVFGAGGLQALALGGLPVAGKHIVIAGTGPLLLPVAAHLRQMGARVGTVAEQASRRRLGVFLSRHPEKMLQGLHFRAAAGGSHYRTGCWPVAALGTDRLQAIRLTDGARTWTETCDMLGCGFHLVPNTELASLLGCRLCKGYIEVDELQQTTHPGIFAAGEPTGIAGLDFALLTGTIAGLAVAGKTEEARALLPRRKKLEQFAAGIARAFDLRPELLTLAEDSTLVCRCEDVSYGALRAHRTWTDAKLQTRCGMGPCQGRICGPATAALFGWQVSSVRPPLVPVPVSALANEPGQ